jgi:transglutaminase superfamily protein
MHATAPVVSYPTDTPTAMLAGNSFASVPAYTSTLILPDGPEATFTTLAAMAALVRGESPLGVSFGELPDISGYQDERIVNFAERLVDSCLVDSHCEVEKLFDFVAHKITYLAHPIDKQVAQDAWRTIQFQTGDCVSKSVLLATLLASLGYRPFFIAQYMSDETGYSHVYCAVIDGSGNELRLDPVASDKPMGWSQPVSDGGFETSFPIF